VVYLILVIGVANFFLGYALAVYWEFDLSRLSQSWVTSLAVRFGRGEAIDLSTAVVKPVGEAATEPNFRPDPSPAPAPSPSRQPDASSTSSPEAPDASASPEPGTASPPVEDSR